MYYVEKARRNEPTIFVGPFASLREARENVVYSRLVDNSVVSDSPLTIKAVARLQEMHPGTDPELVEKRKSMQDFLNADIIYVVNTNNA